MYSVDPGTSFETALVTVQNGVVGVPGPPSEHADMVASTYNAGAGWAWLVVAPEINVMAAQVTAARVRRKTTLAPEPGPRGNR